MEKVTPLTNDEYESLLVLQNSPHWRVYKKVLSQQITSRAFGELALTDGSAALKSIGERAGINLAINLLEQLSESHKVRLQKAEEKNQKRQ